MNKFISLSGEKVKDSHSRELLWKSSEAFALRVVGIGAACLFTLLITRNFGPQTMGIFALSITVLQITSIIGRLGLDSALLRFVAEYSAQGRRDLIKEVYIKALKMAVPVSLILSFLLFYLAPYLAEVVFRKAHMAPYFRIGSLAVLPMVLVSLHVESLRGLKKIREYMFFQNVMVSIVALMILAGWLFFSRETHAPLIAYIIGLALVAGASIRAWMKNSKLTLVSHKAGIRFKDVLDVSLPMLLASSLMFLMHWVDIVMLGVFRSEGEVGVYSVALRVAALTSITLFAINSIAAPKFAEFYGKGDMKALGEMARQSTRLIFWSSFPILLAIFLFPSLVLGIFGADFKEGVYALLILAFGQFVNSISGSVGFILQMTGKQKVFQYIILSAAAINIILNAILIPRYGINGAALASMISMMFWNLASVFMVRQYYGFWTIYLPLPGVRW